MIKENQRVLNIFNALSDAAFLVASVVVSYLIRFYIFEGESGHIRLRYYLALSLLLVPLFLFLYALSGLYESFRSKTFVRELELLIQANCLGTALIIALLFIIEDVNVSRWLLVIFFVVSTGAIGLKRLVLRRTLRRFRSLGYNQKHILIVGSGKTALQYLSVIRKDPSLGLKPDGYVAAKGTNVGGLRRLGDFSQLERILSRQSFDEVVAALSLEETAQIAQIIQACEKSGVKISLIPFYTDYMSSHPYFDEVGGLPLMNIRRIPLDNLANAAMKRAMDVVGSLVLIVLTSPLMLLAAVGIKLTSPGPVIFRQERVGLNKKPFVMYKFRSMRVNSTQNTAWSQNKDPRRTRFGSLLRKCSIDELPQFFNVLKGDMSLVGPRPELPHFVAQFKETIPLYMVKHQVRPGITGWAQVNGLRGDTSIEERVRYDLFYIENWSILFDIKILFLTLFKGVVNQESLS